MREECGKAWQHTLDFLSNEFSGGVRMLNDERITSFTNNLKQKQAERIDWI